MKVVLSGGGTGGHVYPLIAIAERIKKINGKAQFYYIGTSTGAEKKLVQGMPFFSIKAAPFPMRKISFSMIKFLFCFLFGFIKSFFILKKLRPHLVVCSGGYVSSPVIVASKILGLKIMIHEQNLIPGRANRLLARFASLLTLTYPETSVFFSGVRTEVVGYPLRRRIELINKEKARKKLGIARDAFVILVTGGSRGARSINAAFAAIADQLINNSFTVIHSTGLGTAEYKPFEETKEALERKGIYGHKNYILKEFIKEIELAYSAADLVVCRAGAGTVEEIKSLKIPAIFVPKLGLPGEHQLSNVIPLKKAGVCEILFEDYERGLDPEILLSLLLKLKGSPEKLEEMRSNYEKLTEANYKKLEEVIEEILSERETREVKRKQYYLRVKGREFPLLFEKNFIGRGWLASLRIKDLRCGSFTIYLRGDNVVLKTKEGLKQLCPGEAFAIGEERFELVAREETGRTDRESSFLRRFASSATGIFVTRVFGFLREVVIGGYFGTTLKTDMFAVALMVANLFRRVLAENAMDNAFLPTFLRIKHRKSEDEAWRLASSVGFLFFSTALVLVIVGEFTINSWFHIIAPGFVKKGIIEEAIKLTSIMLPFLAIITLSAWLAALAKAANRFGMAEGSAVLFDAGVIAAVILLSKRLDYMSLGYGVIIGGVVQFLFLLYLINSRKVSSVIGPAKFYRPSLSVPGVAVVVLLTLPLLFDVLFSKLSDVVDKILATPLENGAVAALYFAAILFRLPVGVIANSINNVVLRDFSAKMAEYKRQEAKAIFFKGLRYNFLLLMPATFFAVYFAEPIVSIVFQRGNFDERSVALTSGAFMLYAFAIISWGILGLAGRMFAARLETQIAALTNAATITLNVVLSVILVKTVLGYKGLALATSISLYFGALLRLAVLKGRMKKDGMEFKWGELFSLFWKSFVAALVALGISASVFHLLKGMEIGSGFLSKLISLSLSWVIGLVFYGIFAMVFQLIPPVGNNSVKPEEISVHLLPVTRIPEVVAKDPQRYREEMFYRVEALLRSSNWQLRNVGVKLAGILKYEHHRERLERLLLEDEIPFIRRNAASALASLSPRESTIDALIKATVDSYFEVRSRACYALGKIASESEKVKHALFACLEDSYFEVKVEAIKSLSLIFGKEILERLRKFYYDSNFKIREACVDAVENLLKRGKISKEEARKEVKKVLDVSENFEPSFPIKIKIAKIIGGK